MSAVAARVRAHDWRLLDEARTLAGAPLAELSAALPTLDVEGRRLAVACLGVIGGAARHDLLRLCRDPSLEVRRFAADTLRSLVTADDVSALAGVLGESRDALVRSFLYLALGRAGRATNDLATLRALARREDDARALRHAQAAAVRLGGVEERADFGRWIGGIDVDDAALARDLLLYVGERALATALQPWLGREDAVTRVGSDAARRMARLCDIALWTAHELGVVLAPAPAALDRYDDAALAQAARALQALAGEAPAAP